MDRHKAKNKRRLRRRRHIRKRVRGTIQRPRLTVFRSNRHIYCQVIDDESGRTLAAVSTQSAEVRSALGSSSGGNRGAAVHVGKVLAERAKSVGVTAVAFDRNGYKFHGRIEEIAKAAREGGLQF